MVGTIYRDALPLFFINLKGNNRNCKVRLKIDVGCPLILYVLDAFSTKNSKTHFFNSVNMQQLARNDNNILFITVHGYWSEWDGSGCTDNCDGYTGKMTRQCIGPFHNGDDCSARDPIEKGENIFASNLKTES